MWVINFCQIKTYSGGSYEKRAMNTQHRPFPGISSISTCGSPLPFNINPWRAENLGWNRSHFGKTNITCNKCE